VSQVLSAASIVFSLTAATNQLVADLLTTAPKNKRPRLVRVMNAVALPRRIPEKEQFVLVAGELGLRKGTDVLLKAWSTVTPQHPGWTLRMAGPLADGITNDEHIPGIVMLGVLPRSEVLALQGRAAIAVLPSRHEALPMFLIESMAHECATIATPVGQVRDLLADAGLLVEVGDETSLADALDRLMTNEDERRMLGTKARQKIRAHYSEEAVSMQLESEWLSMLHLPARKTGTP
jgi:glycosyltransferase involved in cell wall biosynthesis